MPRWRSAPWSLSEPDERARADALLTLGNAQLLSGDSRAGRATFARAFEEAEKRFDGGRDAVRAALGYGAGNRMTGTTDHDLIRLLERALEAPLPPGDPLGVQVRSRLASALVYVPGAEERRAALAADAVATARELHDERLLAATLAEAFLAVWPADMRTRLPETLEAVATARRADAPDLVALGLALEAGERLGQCDRTGFDSVHERYLALAEELRHPIHRWWARLQHVLVAQFAGDLDEAERRARRGFAVGREFDPVGAPVYFGDQMATIRREQGRLGEVVDSMERFTATIPIIPSARAHLAAGYQQAGRNEDALRTLESMFEELPAEATRLPALVVGAQVHVAAGGPAERAAWLYDTLEPLSGRAAISGPALTFHGTVDHALGLLARSLGQTGAAERHFDRALEQAETLRAVDAARSAREARRSLIGAC